MVRLKNSQVGLLIFLACLFFPYSAGAVNTESVGLLPGNADANVEFSDSWFMYKLDLGRDKIDAVRVLNNKDETVIVKLYAVDATTTADGSFALLSEDDKKGDVGSWVELSANELEIPPKSEKRVPFIIKIPDNADVGDHMGGIVVQEMDNAAGASTGMGVKIITRVGVRIYETVPGEVKKDFEVTRFDWRLEPSGNKSFIKDLLDINKRTVFFTGIKNKGNVRISPNVTLDIKNIFGMTVAHLPNRQMGNIFPREEINEGTIIWEKMPFFGRYTVHANVDFFEEGVGHAQRDLVIWVVPYRVIFLLIILAVLFILARLIALYFRESAKEKMPIYKVKLGDNLADLGQRFFVPWRKIAKLNYIGEPFEIKEGEKLFIPINKKNIEIIRQAREVDELIPSIMERSKKSGLKKMRVFLIVLIFILVGAGAAWGIRFRRGSVIHQEIAVPKNEETPPKETAEKTKSGVFKKSSVHVSIVTPEGADQKSSEQLKKKLELIGYPVEFSDKIFNQEHAATTIEYKTGKKEEAEMLKNDLGAKEDIAMQEKSDLGDDIVIYNLSPIGTYFFVEEPKK